MVRIYAKQREPGQRNHTQKRSFYSDTLGVSGARAPYGDPGYLLAAPNGRRSVFSVTPIPAVAGCPPSTRAHS